VLGAISASIAGVPDIGSASSLLDSVKEAMDVINQDQVQVGANLTFLNYTNSQLTAQRDHLTAANSRIRDVDVADESTRYAREQILVQAGTAMLAQANQSPAAVLRLLQ
jgi:flagellin